MTRKLYDRDQGNGPVTVYKMIDGEMVAVRIARATESEYKRKTGRCEDAPCCGCCD